MFYFSSNLPPAGGFRILNATLAVSGTATSQTGLAGITGVPLVLRCSCLLCGHPQYLSRYLVTILVDVLDSPVFCVVEGLFQVRRLGRQDLLCEPDLRTKCLQYKRSKDQAINT